MIQLFPGVLRCFLFSASISRSNFSFSSRFALCNIKTSVYSPFSCLLSLLHWLLLLLLLVVVDNLLLVVGCAATAVADGGGCVVTAVADGGDVSSSGAGVYSEGVVVVDTVFIIIVADMFARSETILPFSIAPGTHTSLVLVSPNMRSAISSFADPLLVMHHSFSSLAYFFLSPVAEYYSTSFEVSLLQTPFPYYFQALSFYWSMPVHSPP